MPLGVGLLEKPPLGFVRWSTGLCNPSTQAHGFVLTIGLWRGAIRAAPAWHYGARDKSFHRLAFSALCALRGVSITFEQGLPSRRNVRLWSNTSELRNLSGSLCSAWFVCAACACYSAVRILPEGISGLNYSAAKASIP